jgi:hypothetical protein
MPILTELYTKAYATLKAIGQGWKEIAKRCENCLENLSGGGVVKLHVSLLYLTQGNFRSVGKSQLRGRTAIWDACLLAGGGGAAEMYRRRYPVQLKTPQNQLMVDVTKHTGKYKIR